MGLLSLLYWGTAFVVGFLGAAYIYLSIKFQYWKKRGVPYLKPTFPAGNVWELMLSTKNIGEVYGDLYNKTSDLKYVGFYQFQRPTLMLNDPETIKNFLVKDFSHFHDRGFLFDEKIEPLGANLFQLEGERWKELRTKVSPTFTSGKMKMMFQTVVDCAMELQKCFQEPAKKGQIMELKDEMARFTTDVIATCAFGIECNCLKDPEAEFRKWGRKAFEPSFSRRWRDLIYVTAPKLAISLGISNLPSSVSDFFINVVKETVSYREKNNVRRNDFMQLLIQLKNRGTFEDDVFSNGGMITMTEVASQAFLFFIAGFETSATTLSFTLYELALNQTIQDRLRQEIDDILKKHDGKITYENVQEMSYLDKVMAETLRKHPPAPVLLRECTKEYKIPQSKVVIEEGCQVIIPTLALHYDPRHFPDPFKYDPERFNEEVKSQRHHYAYLPFGEGPRTCIGMRFAQMQTKVGLVALLSKYEFHTCNKTLVPAAYDPKSFILFMEGGTWLQIKNRSK